MNAKLRRCIWFVLGILLNSLGIVLITKAALGNSPISSLPYVLSFAFPLTLGQFTFLVNLLFIAGQMVLRRRNFAPIQLLQIVVNVIFSGCIDTSTASGSPTSTPSILRPTAAAAVWTRWAASGARPLNCPRMNLPAPAIPFPDGVNTVIRL